MRSLLTPDMELSLGTPLRADRRMQRKQSVELPRKPEKKFFCVLFLIYFLLKFKILILQPKMAASFLRSDLTSLIQSYFY